MNTMSQLEILTKNLLGFVDTKAAKKKKKPVKKVQTLVDDDTTKEEKPTSNYSHPKKARHKLGDVVRVVSDEGAQKHGHSPKDIFEIAGAEEVSPGRIQYSLRKRPGSSPEANKVWEYQLAAAGDKTTSEGAKKETKQPVAGASPAASILTGQSNVVSTPTTEESTPSSVTIGGEKQPKRTKADMDEERQRLSKVKFPLSKVEDVGEVAKRAREKANIEDISSSGGESEEFSPSESRHAGRALFERPPYRGTSDPKRAAMRQRFSGSMLEQTREGDFTPEEISKEQELLERRRQRQPKESQSFKTPKVETPTPPKPAETGKLTVGDVELDDDDIGELTLDDYDPNAPEAPDWELSFDDDDDDVFEHTEFDVPADEGGDIESEEEEEDPAAFLDNMDLSTPSEEKPAPVAKTPAPKYESRPTKLAIGSEIDTSVGGAPKPSAGAGEEFPEVQPVEKDNFPLEIHSSEIERPKIPKPKFDTDYTARHTRTGEQRKIRLNEGARITYGGVTDQGKHRWKVRRSDVVEHIKPLEGDLPEVQPVEKNNLPLEIHSSEIEYPVHPIGPSRSGTPKKTRSSRTEYPEVVPVRSSEPRSRSRSESRPPAFRVPEGGGSAPADSGFDWSELTPSSRSRKPKSMLVQFTKDMLGVDPEAYEPHSQENESQEEWYEFFLEPEEEWQEQSMRGTKASPRPVPRMNSNQSQHSGYDYDSPELQGIASTMTPLPSFDDDYEQEDPETKMCKLLDRAAKFFYRMSREKNLGQRHRDEAEEIRQGVLSSLPGAMGKVEEKSKGPNVTKIPE